MPRTISPEHRARIALAQAEQRIVELTRENAALRHAILTRDIVAAYGEGVSINPDGTIVEAPSSPPEPATAPAGEPAP